MGTEAVLAVFAAFFLASWWWSRRSTADVMARALLAPVATVVVYLASEALKVVVHEERPCRQVPDVDPIAACPAPGDWSLPSNHAGIAAAALVTVALAWRWLALAVAPVTVLAAASRVFVGVHYPHDVLAGLALGAIVAPLVVVVFTRPVAALVERLRVSPLRPLLTTGPRSAGGAHARVAPTAPAPRSRYDAARR